MDGSLGIAFYYQDRWVFASRGSFTSDQAIKGYGMFVNLLNTSRTHFSKGYTYLFEIIYPENRIVVDYMDAERLVLLGKIGTLSGEEYSLDLFRKDPVVDVVREYTIKDYTKLKSLNLTKYYRTKKNLKTYNAILFNTESIHRKDIFLLPKICKAAISASKNKKKTIFGNIDIVREWNWAEDQCDLLVKFVKKKPQDFILSNGKPYSIKKMISYAFQYFKLDYTKYIKVSKKFYKKGEAIKKKSDYLYYLNKNNIKKKSFIHGKKLIHLMIKFYLTNKMTKY